MKKTRWLGSFLNLMAPGLGYFYSGNTRLAVVTFVVSLLMALSLRFVAYNFVLMLMWVCAMIVFYLYLMVTAYRSIDEGREYEASRYDKLHVYVIILVLYFGFIEIIRGRPIDTVTPINFATIPTPAMDPTLKVGDHVAFRKTKSLERGDVTIFWFPGDENWPAMEKTIYIKRCIGLPGDTLQIEGGVVMINGKQEKKIPLKFGYLVTTDGAPISNRILKQNGLSESDYLMISGNTYRFLLTEDEAAKLRKLKFLKGVELSVRNEGEGEQSLYPQSEAPTWNPDFYGPLYVPKKGDKIELNTKNIDRYLKCIASENGSVERDSSGLVINGEPHVNYEFKEDYFFMMGDSRHNSLDSRYWGFLPKNLVIGKAMYLYWASTMDRVGKTVN